MESHDRLRICFTEACQNWRAFAYVMQVHEKRHTKRAGVAGIALRARAFRRDSSRAAAPRCDVFYSDIVRGVGFSLVRVERDW
ncbi:hypothetical protein DMB81_018250 [Pectobacterium aquaticum]|nr:hypothetical protein DMB81_018250 [Pectobacterium aquaticum]